MAGALMLSRTASTAPAPEGRARTASAVKRRAMAKETIRNAGVFRPVRRRECGAARGRSAPQALGDAGDRGQALERADRRDRGRAGEESPPGRSRLLDRHRVDLADDLLARDQAAPGQ